MRANILNIPSVFNSTVLNHYKKPILLIILILVLVTLIPLDHLWDSLPFLLRSREINANVSVPLHHGSKSPSPSDFRTINPNDSTSLRLNSEHRCNIFRGNWVPYTKGPYYTNKTGCVMDDGENCMKFGRPDDEFMKWRWKPDDCELPLFDGAKFMELVKGKSMAFVGDSLARNQVQSLACMLSSVARPVEKSNATRPRFRRWFYTEYNFTIVLLSTTHLVKAHGVDALYMNPIDLYLDEVDEFWATQINGFDYVIISAGHWFSRLLRYHEKHKITGCFMCKEKNITDLTRFYGYKMAFQTAFRALLDLQGFKGTVFLRTVSPVHFEAEEWEGRGYCVRRRPFTKGEVKLDWYLSMFYKIQAEEFRAARREGKERGLKFRLLDITEAMRMRPDGHPNHYGHPPGKKKRSADCLHWCLPGPIDAWNELLLQMLKTEEEEGEGSI